MSRRALRSFAPAFERACDRYAPATPLVAVQRAWPTVAGPVLAREALPVAERAGVVTIACRSSVWAQELDLLSEDLLGRLRDAASGVELQRLRIVATGLPQEG